MGKGKMGSSNIGKRKWEKKSGKSDIGKIKEDLITIGKHKRLEPYTWEPFIGVREPHKEKAKEKKSKKSSSSKKKEERIIIGKYKRLEPYILEPII